MAISDLVKRIQYEVGKRTFTSKASIKQGIFLPILNELGWPVFDIRTVYPKFIHDGRFIDYALCHPANQPLIFVEMKNADFLHGMDRQPFEENFHLGVSMAILIDGYEWSFYLAGEQSHYNELRFCKLDFLDRSLEETIIKLERYLRHEKVCSGEALMSARSDYQCAINDLEIRDSLQKAWNLLLKENSLFQDLLTKKVEDLYGIKPSSDLCNHFLKHDSKQSILTAPFSTKKLQLSDSVSRQEIEKNDIRSLRWIQSKLKDGEQIIWSGSSNGRMYRHSPIVAIISTLFGAIFVIFLNLYLVDPVIQSVQNLYSNFGGSYGDDSLYDSYGDSLFLIFFYVGGFILGTFSAISPWLSHRKSRIKYIYIVTTKRVLIIFHKSGKKDIFESILPKDINTISVREYKDGSGSIVLSQKINLYQSGISWNKRGLFDISDVRGAAAALCSLVDITPSIKPALFSKR